MNMTIELGQTSSAWPVSHALAGMPEAFKRAYGPTEAFPGDVTASERINVSPLPYRGRRPISLRSRGACRIFAVLPDLEAGRPRIYGCESQTELHHLVLTLVDPQVRQVHEQFGPVPFFDADGQYREHYFDLLIVHKDGRRIGVAVKPEERLVSGRVLSELRQLRATMPAGLVDEIRLVTERHYRRSSAFNATMYLRFKLTCEPELDARLTEVIFDTPGETTIADLIKRSRTGQGGFRAAVRAIFEGRLTKLSGGRIDLFTLVETAV